MQVRIPFLFSTCFASTNLVICILQYQYTALLLISQIPNIFASQLKHPVLNYNSYSHTKKSYQKHRHSKNIVISKRYMKIDSCIRQQNIETVHLQFVIFELKDNGKFSEHCYGYQHSLRVPVSKIGCIWIFFQSVFYSIETKYGKRRITKTPNHDSSTIQLYNILWTLRLSKLSIALLSQFLKLIYIKSKIVRHLPVFIHNSYFNQTLKK